MDETFNTLRIAIRDEDYDKMKEISAQVDRKTLAGNGMFRQLILYAEILTGPELDVHSAVDKLIEILRITKRDFNLDSISGYRLRSDELTIINEIGHRYLNAGEFEKAAKVFQDAMTSMDTFCPNLRLRCEIYSGLLYNLSICYGKLGRHSEAEQVCHAAKEFAAQYGCFGTLPFQLNNIGAARFRQGDISGALKMAVQAYYTARAMGKQALTEKIKVDAKRELGIDLSVIEDLLLESAGRNQKAESLENPPAR
jgi:tetratricopeptide (TPR) repeat protein